MNCRAERYLASELELKRLQMFTRRILISKGGAAEGHGLARVNVNGDLWKVLKRQLA